MRDRRPVDELTVEELEQILAIRRRAARQERLRRYDADGRRLPAASLDEPPPLPGPPPAQHEASEGVEPVEPPLTYDLTDDVPRFEDELAPAPPRVEPVRPAAPTASPGRMARRRRRAGWDRLLLLVEVLGVLGIAAVLIVGGYLTLEERRRIEALEQKSAEVQREAEAMRPTPSPQPELHIELADYVLPGGHYSPDVTGGEYAFNLEELPESIRPLAMAQVLGAPQAARATPAPASPMRVVINTARVQVDASIYGGDDWYSLLKGVGHYAGSANPGERANMVLSAHNDIYGETFRYIEFLKAGDEIRIQAQNNQWYTYEVYDRQIVSPNAVHVLERGNQPIVTLITCYPYRVDTQRVVVFARLRE